VKEERRRRREEAERLRREEEERLNREIEERRRKREEEKRRREEEERKRGTFSVCCPSLAHFLRLSPLLYSHVFLSLPLFLAFCSVSRFFFFFTHFRGGRKKAA
jgi:hypothetical protein